MEFDDGLLPTTELYFALKNFVSHEFRFTLAVLSPNLFHFDIEQRLNCRADIEFRRIFVNFKCVRILVFGVGKGPLGHNRSQDDLVRFQQGGRRAWNFMFHGTIRIRRGYYPTSLAMAVLVIRTCFLRRIS